jgi:hypothetical protein
MSTSCEHLERLECTVWVTIDRSHYCPPCGADLIQYLLGAGVSPAAIAKRTSFPEFHSIERYRRMEFIRKLTNQLNQRWADFKRAGRNTDANRIARVKTQLARKTAS